MTNVIPPDEPDYELEVSRSEDATVVTTRLDVSAAEAFRLFCSAEHIAEWLFVVGTVVVHRRDAQDRALEADFMGSLQRASIAYTLLYEYDDEVLEVRWRHRGSGLKQLAGSARFLPEGESVCRLRYTLTTELPGHLPPWSDELYRARPAETVVLDFCDWLHARAKRSGG